ncbi:MAG: YdbH domain-containing protein [Opitutales bacterium]|nr:YdbH domain-containing protein [Opitutales bacterium]
MRKVVSWLLVVLWFLLMSVVFLWVTVPFWLAAVWNRILPDSAGSIVYRDLDVSPWRTKVEGLEWSRDGFRVEIGSLEISMSMASLLKGEVEGVLIQGLLIEVKDPSALSTRPDSTLVARSDHGQPVFLNRQWLQYRIPAIPIGRVLVSGFEVSVGDASTDPVGLDGSMGFRKEDGTCHFMVESCLGDSQLSVLAEWEEATLEQRMWVGFQGQSISAWVGGLISALRLDAPMPIELERMEGGLQWRRDEAGVSSLRTQWLSLGMSDTKGDFSVEKIGLRVEGSGGLSEWDLHVDVDGLTAGEALKSNIGMDGSVGLNWDDPLQSVAELTVSVDALKLNGSEGGADALNAEAFEIGGTLRNGAVELDASAVRVDGIPIIVTGAHVGVEDAWSSVLKGNWTVGLAPSVAGLKAGDGSIAPMVLSGKLEWDPRNQSALLPQVIDSCLKVEPIVVTYADEGGTVMFEPSMQLNVETKDGQLRSKVSLAVKDAGTRWRDLTVREMGLSLDGSTDWRSLDGWIANPVSVAKNSVWIRLDANAKGSLNGTPWAVQSLELFRDGDCSPDALIQAGIASLDWDGFKVMDFSGAIEHQSTGDIRHRWTARILDPSLNLSVEGRNPASDRTLNEVHWTLGSVSGDEPIHLDLNLPGGDIGQVRIDGLLQATGAVQTRNTEVQADVEASIANLSLAIPKLDLEVSGVSLADAKVDSLIPLRDESPQVLNVESIRLAKVTLHDARVEFRALQDGGLEVSGASVGFCGGTVRLAEKFVLRPPWKEIHFTIEMENVEAAEVAALIPEFQAEVSGKLGGRIPLMLDDGYIRWGHGYVALMPGETGRFRQTDTRWLDGYLPDVVIDPKHNIRLNEAVQDMVVTGMRLDLVPTGQAAEEPSMLLLQGHSFSKDTRIPIEGIRINLRGDIEEGLNLYLGFDKKLKQGASF